MDNHFIYNAGVEGVLMSKNDLLSNYSLKPDGELDEFLVYHPNCMVKCVYWIMKNRVKVEFDPYDLFLEDFTFCLTEITSDNYYFRYLEYEPQYPDGLFDMRSYHAAGNKEVFALQEKLLNEGYLVINKIDLSKIPFSFLYQSGREEWGHLFLSVWLDDEFLYYVDEPRLVNKAFQPYSLNKEVGLIEREKMSEMSSTGNLFRTITFNEDMLSKMPLNTLPIKVAINNFYGEEFVALGEVNYCGKRAYEKIIAICDQNPACKIDNMVTQVYDFDFLRILTGRKKVLHQWLSNHSHNTGIVNTSQASLDCWEKIRMYLLMKKYREENYFDQNCKMLFTELLNIEESLIGQLGKLAESAG